MAAIVNKRKPPKCALSHEVEGEGDRSINGKGFRVSSHDTPNLGLINIQSRPDNAVQQVPFRKDANNGILLSDEDTANFILSHEVNCICDRRTRGNNHRRDMWKQADRLVQEALIQSLSRLGDSLRYGLFFLYEAVAWVGGRIGSGVMLLPVS